VAVKELGKKELKTKKRQEVRNAKAKRVSIVEGDNRKKEHQAGGNKGMIKYNYYFIIF